MSHTPGPWTLSPLRTSVRGADKAPVALLSARTEEQDEANARLIAGAPTMADALLWIRENLHPQALGRPATDAELYAITHATFALRAAGVIPMPELTEVEP